MPFSGGWQGSMAGIDPSGMDDRFEVYMQKIFYDCYFVVFFPARDITLFYKIDGGRPQCEMYPGQRLTCRDPKFVLEDFEINGCNGRLVIERKMLEPVPFHANTQLQSLTQGEVPTCGNCSQYCNVLCLEWSLGGEAQKTEFRINTEGAQVYWTARLADGSIATITAHEAFDGNCYLTINHSGLGPFQPIAISDGMCNLGMVIEAQGIYLWPNKRVSISCNRCTCWDYVCELCRCVCKTMCIVSVNGTESTDIIRYELDWDPVKLRWGNDEKWVGVRANPITGKCEFNISGWTDGPYVEFEPTESTIEIEECGGDMSYFVTTNSAKAFETGIFRYEYGVCKSCEPECLKTPCGQCCDECDNGTLPDTLYLSLRGWPVAAGEDPGPAARRCLEVFDIPLVRTRPLFSVLNVWEGHVIVSCGCPTDPLTDDPSPNATRIDVFMYCNGVDDWYLGVSMKGSTSSVMGSDNVYRTDPIKTTSFSCNPVSWTGLLNNVLGFNGNSNSCCCDSAPLFDFEVYE